MCCCASSSTQLFQKLAARGRPVSKTQRKTNVASREAVPPRGALLIALAALAERIEHVSVSSSAPPRSHGFLGNAAAVSQSNVVPVRVAMLSGVGPAARSGTPGCMFALPLMRNVPRALVTCASLPANIVATRVERIIALAFSVGGFFSELGRT